MRNDGGPVVGECVMCRAEILAQLPLQPQNQLAVAQMDRARRSCVDNFGTNAKYRSENGEDIELLALCCSGGRREVLQEVINYGISGTSNTD